MLPLNDRLSWLATISTVTLMFIVIRWFVPEIERMTNIPPLAVAGLGVTGSLAIYRLAADFLKWIFGKSLWLRRMILGRFFLEGTWGGCIKTLSGHTITIEFIDQSSGKTIVRGRQLDTQGNTLASWTSESASIEEDRLIISYAYLCSVYSANTSHQGLASFSMVIQESGKAPSKLDGYSTDLTNGKRDKNTEIKLSDKPMDDIKAISEAKRIFNIS